MSLSTSERGTQNVDGDFFFFKLALTFHSLASPSCPWHLVEKIKAFPVFRFVQRAVTFD